MREILNAPLLYVIYSEHSKMLGVEWCIFLNKLLKIKGKQNSVIEKCKLSNPNTQNNHCYIREHYPLGIFLCTM